jgi:hypothetical protein
MHAFERFEEDVDIREIRSFRELRLAFSFWAGKKWKETPRQIKALRVEAKRVGIPVKRVRKARPRVVRPYKVETITRPEKFTSPIFPHLSLSNNSFITLLA